MFRFYVPICLQRQHPFAVVALKLKGNFLRCKTWRTALWAALLVRTCTAKKNAGCYHYLQLTTYSTSWRILTNQNLPERNLRNCSVSDLRNAIKHRKHQRFLCKKSQSQLRLLAIHLQDLISNTPTSIKRLPHHHTTHLSLVVHQIDACTQLPLSHGVVLAANR